MADDINEWLEDRGLGKYAEAFAENEIDLAALPHLTEADLKDLGVALGARRKILAATSDLQRQPRQSSVETEPSGTEPERPAEQRQVTVLFADLAGFTQLSDELGGEATHALLNRYFDTADRIIEFYGGKVDKHIGDNVMAVFGAPIAHSNDPERALRAALDIHRAMTELSEEFGRELRAHIGIASGQVMASGTGSDAHREYTVTGSSVNLASRLQETASAGETLISQAVYRSVLGLAEMAPVGELEVKGFSEAIPTWTVRNLHREPVVNQRSPFIGRRVELRQFTMLVEDCLESGSGHTILVRGEAGIGKTRLLEEFISVAKKQGLISHSALILDFGVGKGQDAIRSILRSLLGLSEGDSDEQREAAVDQAIETGLLAEDARVFLNDLLDLPQPSEWRTVYEAMDNATRNAGKQDTVSQLVKALGANRPLLLTIEDIHWADSLTLGHLAAVASTVAHCPAILVMTTRIEGDPIDRAWRASLAGSPMTTIDLQPLRPAEAEELANSFAQTEGTLIRDCIARAEGNPLFLEQLLRYAEEGFPPEVPDSIQSLVLARKDRLDLRDRQGVQAAAVIGKRFTIDALRALLQDAKYDCSTLVEHYLVRPEGEGYLFAHSMIQECIYASILQREKRALHRRAADWFADRDAVLYAEHLDRAGDDEAPRAYLDAAREQAAAYHYERALRLVRRGLELAKSATERWKLTCLHGELLHDKGDIEASAEAYKNALELAESDRQRVSAWIGLAADMRMRDDYESALEILAKAEEVAKKARLGRELSRIHHLRGNIYFPLGRIEECRKQHELALTEARQAGARDCEAQALGGLGDAAFAQGRMASARDNFARCAELSEAQGLGRSAVAYAAMLGDANFYLCEIQKGKEASEAAAERAAKVGHYRAQAIAHRAVVICALELGDLVKAREHWEKSHEILHSHGLRRFKPVDLITQSALAVNEGNLDKARCALEEALEICRETGQSFCGPWVLGALSVLTEDADRRRKLLSDGERILKEGSLAHNHLWFYRCAIEACLKYANWDAAERYALALQDYTRAEPLPWSDYFTRWGLALAQWGKGKSEASVKTELQSLQKEGEELGLSTALPMIAQALEEA